MVVWAVRQLAVGDAREHLQRTWHRLPRCMSPVMALNVRSRCPLKCRLSGGKPDSLCAPRAFQSLTQFRHRRCRDCGARCCSLSPHQWRAIERFLQPTARSGNTRLSWPGASNHARPRCHTGSKSVESRLDRQATDIAKPTFMELLRKSSGCAHKRLLGSPAGVSLFSIPGVSASYPCDRTRSSEPACPTIRLVPDGTLDVPSINLRLMVANLPFDYAF